MLTKKDFEVTDIKEIFAVDVETVKQTLQRDFTDEVNKIGDAVDAGLYDSDTAGFLLIEPFKGVFYPIFLQIIIAFQLIILMPVEGYIYIARKIFKHKFSQRFRKKYINNVHEKGSKFLKIDLDYNRTTKESYKLRMQKLDKYMTYYEWETFEK